MSIEETLQAIVDRAFERAEERIANRIAEKLRSAVARSDDRLLGPDDDLSGYAWETIKKWVTEGKLTRYGTKRRLRVSERELRALLATNGIEPKDGEPNDAQILQLAKAKARRQ